MTHKCGMLDALGRRLSQWPEITGLSANKQSHTSGTNIAETFSVPNRGDIRRDLPSLSPQAEDLPS
ncbi:MAG: hypothetical protein AB7V46_24220, partial [Thermomicrobiales bacterium]